MTGDGQLDETTDELYAHPPAEFVARRDALARQARSAGDRERAAQIKALRRPSVGAWYLNTAARAGLVSLRELLHLGQDLRDAQAGGEVATLRDLAARRGPLVSRVLGDLTAHLSHVGTTPTPAGLDEVRRTLAAALADPEVADLVVRGQLDRGHDYSGFGPAPTAGAAAPASLAPTASPSGSVAADRREAEQAFARAELHAAETALAAAAARRTSAESELAAARERVAGLLSELEQANDAVAAGEIAATTAAEREQVAGARVKQALERLGGIPG